MLLQGIDQQVRGMQRLQQVVANCGEETTLCIVGVLGLALGGFKQGGALVHALFEGLVDALETVLGLTKVGDIRESGNETATGHRIAADFDDVAVLEHPLGQVRRACTHMFQPTRKRFSRTIRIDAGNFTQGPLRRIRDRHAHLQHAGRVAQQFFVAAIPRHQMQVRIDHADALAHVLQRRFQQALVEAQVFPRLADDFRHRIEIGTGLRAPGGVQQQACRRAAEHRCQFVFQP